MSIRKMFRKPRTFFGLRGVRGGSFPQKVRGKNSLYSFIFALMLGVMLAVSVSVWATTVGNSVTVSGSLTVNGGSTLGDASTDVNLFTGTLQASTTALFTGAVTTYGNVTLGDAAGDTFTVTGTSITYSNAGTTTIPSTSAVAWAYATSSADIPLFRLDTSNTRIGISTTTPGATLAVGGAGNIYALGGLGIGLATTTAGAIENSGNILFGDASGDLVMFNSATLVHNNAGTTTIPSSNANSWVFATSTANIPLLRFDTSNTRIGISTTTPGATFSVGGAGNIYALGGLGVGLATTTAGAIENSGNVLFGDASGDLVMFNAAVDVRNNAGTTTIPSANANAYAVATSTSGAFIRFDTTNTRFGISSSSPGATLAVGGDGTAIIMGGATSSLSIQSTGNGAASRGGCIEVESTAGDGTRFSLMATGAGIAYWTTGGCR